MNLLFSCAAKFLILHYSLQYYHHRWFCHFDDDVYVNIRELVALLRNYAPSIEPVYLGRWPLSREMMQVN